MSSERGRPVPRLRLVRGRHEGQPPVEEPRAAEISTLLRRMDDLRLTLGTDLSLAASAVESGEAELAASILDGDREALARFEAAALADLSASSESASNEPVEAPRRSVWAQAHAAPIVAAAALVGVLVGMVPHALNSTGQHPSTTVAATDSLERLQELAAQGDAAQVRAASAVLHEQLAGVVANAKSDPLAAQTALLLLTYEQRAIVRSGDSRALADVLLQSRALAQAIVAALPKPLRTMAPPRIDPAAPAPQATASPKPKPKPSATASHQAKQSPAPAQAQPTASPSPSKDDGYPIPAPPIQP
jgi:hypothetical protein